MEFWGVEVKPGETVQCGPGDEKYLHLSQCALGETKGKGNENVVVFLKIDGQKLVLATLSAEKFSQISHDLVFEKEFELSHTSKNVSVYFCGYKSVAPDEHSEEDYPEQEDAPVGQNANGKANSVKEDDSAIEKGKKTEPAKNDKAEDEGDEDDDEDEEDSDDDEEMVGVSNSDDDEDESSDDEAAATPIKAVTGKRHTEFGSKAPEKKAKIVTPAGGQKTGGDGKKNVHVATPHPAKHAAKTPANSEKPKQQTPKSAGSVPCKSCNRTFNSENALQAHTKAKHGGA